MLADGAVNTAEAEARLPDAVARVRRVLVDEGVEFTSDGRVVSLAGGNINGVGRRSGSSQRSQELSADTVSAAREGSVLVPRLRTSGEVVNTERPERRPQAPASETRLSSGRHVERS